MNKKYLITISRQYGSGGREVGKRLAELLGVPFYDKELLKVAARESGICVDMFVSYDVKPTTSFLYSLVMDTYSMGYNTSAYMDMPINHKIFLAQFDTIKKLADEESCVIVGRCADYALADYPNMVSVFISGNEEDKIRQLMERHDISREKAKDIMIKTDKQRSSYYNYYSSKRWGSCKSYNLCINSSVVGYDGAVEIIKEFAKQKQEFMKSKEK